MSVRALSITEWGNTQVIKPTDESASLCSLMNGLWRHYREKSKAPHSQSAAVGPPNTQRDARWLQTMKLQKQTQNLTQVMGSLKNTPVISTYRQRCRKRAQNGDLWHCCCKPAAETSCKHTHMLYIHTLSWCGKVESKPLFKPAEWSSQLPIAVVDQLVRWESKQGLNSSLCSFFTVNYFCPAKHYECLPGDIVHCSCIQTIPPPTLSDGRLFTPPSRVITQIRYCINTHWRSNISIHLEAWAAIFPLSLSSWVKYLSL